MCSSDLGRECRKALKRYVACLEEIQDHDPFWLSLNGEPLAVDGVREILRRVQRAAGLPKIHDFHDFRRCFALERKRNGDDDITISRALGLTEVCGVNVFSIPSRVGMNLTYLLLY